MQPTKTDPSDATTGNHPFGLETTPSVATLGSNFVYVLPFWDTEHSTVSEARRSVKAARGGR